MYGAKVGVCFSKNVLSLMWVKGKLKDKFLTIKKKFFY